MNRAILLNDVQCRGVLQAMALTFAVFAIPARGVNAQMLSPKLIPERIEMRAFDAGARVHVEGTAPNETGVLIVVRGAEKNEFFNRKVRVGFLWLNADRIHVKQAPLVFLSFASSNTNLLDRATLDRYQLDELAIKNRMICLTHCKCKINEGKGDQSGLHDTQCDASSLETLRTTFLELKKRDGSYHNYPAAVKLARFSDGATTYSLDFEWPRQAPRGGYRVEVYAVRDHNVIAQSTAHLEVAEVGFPAYMERMAAERPWLYGSLAVLVAMFAGFGIDAVTVKLRRRKRTSRLEARLQAEEKRAIESEEKEAEHAVELHHR